MYWNAGNQAFSCSSSHHVLLSFQDLELLKPDHDNQLWVAEANDQTAVTVLSASARAAASQLQAWCDSNDTLITKLQDRVRSLTDGA